MSTIIDTTERPLGHNVPRDLYHKIVEDLVANKAITNPMPEHAIVLAQFYEWYKQPGNKIIKSELANFMVGGMAYHARAVIDARVAATFEALLSRRQTRDDSIVRIALGFGSNYNTVRGKAAISEAVAQDRAGQS